MANDELVMTVVEDDRLDRANVLAGSASARGVKPRAYEFRRDRDHIVLAQLVALGNLVVRTFLTVDRAEPAILHPTAAGPVHVAQ